MRRPTTPLVPATLAAALLAACAPSNQSSQGPAADSVRQGRVEAPTPAPAPPAPAGDDQARIAQLEREARAIARTTGCSSASACRTAPVGARACGGPRSYIVYCAASTDTVALFRVLRDLEQAEKAYNEKSGMMSTCEFRMPPRAVLTGGSCREAPAGP